MVILIFCVSHLSEEDIKLRYITPAIMNAVWNSKQLRLEYAFTAGRIILRGDITARALDLPYVYVSNGDGFVEQNMATGEVKALKLEQFPSPKDLYQRYRIYKGIDEAEEKVIIEPYYYVPNYKTPRYYQRGLLIEL